MIGGRLCLALAGPPCAVSGWLASFPAACLCTAAAACFNSRRQSKMLLNPTDSSALAATDRTYIVHARVSRVYRTKCRSFLGPSPTPPRSEMVATGVQPPCLAFHDAAGWSAQRQQLPKCARLGPLSWHQESGLALHIKHAHSLRSSVMHAQTRGKGWLTGHPAIFGHFWTPHWECMGQAASCGALDSNGSCTRRAPSANKLTTTILRPWKSSCRITLNTPRDGLSRKGRL